LLSAQGFNSSSTECRLSISRLKRIDIFMERCNAMARFGLTPRFSRSARVLSPSLVALSVFATCGCQRHTLYVSESGQIKISAASQKVDVCYGAVAQIPISIRNDSRHRLVFDGVSASCGCGSVKAAQGALDPGERTTLQVEYDSRGVPFGERLLSFAIRESSGDTIVLKDILSVRSKRYVIVEPPAIDFGKIQPGVPQSRRLRVRTVDGCEIGKVSVRASSPMVTAEVDDGSLPQGALRDKEEWKIMLDTASSTGQVDEYLTVTIATATSGDVQVRVEVNGMVDDRISLEPSVAYLGFASAGRMSQLTFEVNEPVDDIIIENISVPECGIASCPFTLRRKQDGTGTLSVQIIAKTFPAESGAFSILVSGQRRSADLSQTIPCTYVTSKAVRQDSP